MENRTSSSAKASYFIFLDYNAFYDDPKQKKLNEKIRYFFGRIQIWRRKGGFLFKISKLEPLWPAGGRVFDVYFSNVGAVFRLFGRPLCNIKSIHLQSMLILSARKHAIFYYYLITSKLWHLLLLLLQKINLCG